MIIGHEVDIFNICNFAAFEFGIA